MKTAYFLIDVTRTYRVVVKIPNLPGIEQPPEVEAEEFVNKLGLSSVQIEDFGSLIETEVSDSTFEMWTDWLGEEEDQ